MASLVESGLQNLSGRRSRLGRLLPDAHEHLGPGGRTRATPTSPSASSTGSSTRPRRSASSGSRAGSPLDDERQYGEWIADVERPAAQYRGRYQEQLDEAHALLRAISDAPDAQHAGPQARQALALVEGQLGKPYLWGGTTPEKGFDCSGLVQWAYKKVGIDLPRVTQDQVNAPGGRHIGRKDLLPGDLVFFRDKTGDVHHVGISMGGDRFVHAPHTGGVVHESSLNEPYYRDEFIGGRRFAAPAAPTAPTTSSGSRPSSGCRARRRRPSSSSSLRPSSSLRRRRRSSPSRRSSADRASASAFASVLVKRAVSPADAAAAASR